MPSENSDDEKETVIHRQANTSSTFRSTTLASLVEPILSNMDVYHDQFDYTTRLLQDHGTSPSSGPVKCPNKVFEFNGHRYKNIWKLADILKKLMKLRTGMVYPITQQTCDNT